jgi:hypothetical protein
MRVGLLSLVCIPLVTACASRPAVDIDETSEGEGSQGDDTMATAATMPGETSVTTTSDEGTSTTGGGVEFNNQVDILVVMDNSGSMGEKQAAFSRSVQVLVDALEDPAVAADYRIAVTTTDNGNPWCPMTGPEAGSFVYSSCVDRLPDFINQSGENDVSQIACIDHCALDSGALGINGTGSPWLEGGAGGSNLPAGISVGDALRCLLPQGINGCGFESPLESLNKSLIRTDTQSDTAFGFLRDEATLAVLVVTDEADCSYNNSWQSIFLTEGNQVFWHPDSVNYPTSAVCWNAGTQCVEDGSGGYDCVPASYDVNGVQIPEGDPATTDDAVLLPMERYISRLQGLEDEKAVLQPGREIVVGLLAGVAGAGAPIYADSPDADFMRNFGIGPGCSGALPGSTPCLNDADCVGIGVQVCGPSGACVVETSAVPPVRLYALAEAFGGSNAYSICENDYDAAMDDFAGRIIEQLGTN